MPAAGKAGCDCAPQRLAKVGKSWHEWGHIAYPALRRQCQDVPIYANSCQFLPKKQAFRQLIDSHFRPDHTGSGSVEAQLIPTALSDEQAFLRVTEANLCQLLPTRANSCQLVPTRANSCQQARSMPAGSRQARLTTNDPKGWHYRAISVS